MFLGAHFVWAFSLNLFLFSGPRLLAGAELSPSSGLQQAEGCSQRFSPRALSINPGRGRWRLPTNLLGGIRLTPGRSSWPDSSRSAAFLLTLSHGQRNFLRFRPRVWHRTRQPAVFGTASATAHDLRAMTGMTEEKL